MPELQPRRAPGVRRCVRSACHDPAVATLTYSYADSQAVLGPLSQKHEPGAYDLCRSHADALSVPRGWDVIRLPLGDAAPPAWGDDLVALADAVRAIGLRHDEPEPASLASVVPETPPAPGITSLAEHRSRRRPSAH